MGAASRPCVVVTGASGGAGRGIAIACGRAGWSVSVAARRAAEGEAVAAEVARDGGAAGFVRCDVTSVASVEEALAAAAGRFGRLDAVVHNATSGESGTPVPAAEVPVASLEEHVAASLRGSYLLARAAHPHLAARGGSLVLLTSEAAVEGKALLAPYAMVKAGQRAMVRALARELGPAGIRVNAVAPLASSPAMERALGVDDELRRRVFGRHPFARLGDPVDDVGPAVAFLIGEGARYITGHILMVDGGSCPIA